MEINVRLPEPEYLNSDPALPDMGRNGLGPRACSPADAAAVLQCRDLVALAQMRGYAKSYFATAGGVALGVTAALVGAITSRRWVAVGGTLTAGMAALVTIEARRRAREWESVIETAITHATTAERTTSSA